MRKFTLLLTAIIGLALTSGCAKDDPTFPFRVTVKGENGLRVQNARVRAYVPLPNTDIEYEGITGVDGNVEFEHIGGEIVVQIQAFKGDDPPVALGCGFLKLEPDQKVYTTIVVEEYDPNDPGCQ